MLAALVGLATVACGSGDEPRPVSTETSSLTPTSAPRATQRPVDLGDVVWATQIDSDTGAPLDEIASLPNDAVQVVAAVQPASLPPDVSIQARWHVDGALIPALDPEPIRVERLNPNTWFTWTLRWTDEQLWPVGTLGIIVEVDGEPLVEADIPIMHAMN